jgi:limonene-1,2-epoxide hydrolase
VTTVRAFFDLAGSSGNLMAALEQYGSEDLVWANSGLPTANGLDEARALLTRFIDGFGLDAMLVELVAIAAAGNTVLTERIDRLNAKDGSEIVTVPVSGTFVVRDGKICAWRDYFDPRPFLPPT